MNEFLIELQAILDEEKSKGNINTNITKIQGKIDKLKLQTEIDPKTISNLTKELENAINQKITLSNINIDIGQTSRTGQQIGQQIGNNINSGLSSSLKEASKNIESLHREEIGIQQQIVQQSSNSTVHVIQDEQRKQEAYRQTANEMNVISNFMNNMPQIKNNVSDGFYADQVQQQTEKYNQLGMELPDIRAKLEELKIAEQELSVVMGNENTTLEQQMKVYQRFQSALKSVEASNSIDGTMFMTQEAIDGLIARLQTFLQKHTNMTSTAKTEINEWIAKLQQGDMVLKSVGNNAVASMKKIEAEQKNIGKMGDTMASSMKQGLSFLSYWTSSAYLIMKAISEIKQGINSIKELDTSLVDLKKTTTMTSSELEEFYHDSNETAKQMGVTTKEIIDQASAWSRLGFSSAEAATKMAKYSSMFATISPGMDLDSATDGLVSTMKAFKIGLEDTDEVVDGIMSKINVIGNSKALNNSDIVDFLTRSSSALAAANNSIEESIAMGEAIIEITRDAAGAGQVMKTTSMRIRGYDEELETYTEDLENLKGEIADLTKTAKTPGGISLFTDDTKETYKSTYKILEEISEIWDDLKDKNQAQLLDVLAGKRNGQALTALISNFDSARESIDLMANSAGNADAELSVVVDSLDYKLNRLKQTGTGIAQNLFDREDMKTVVDSLTTVMNVFDAVTSKLGLFGSIGMGAFAFLNKGRSK